MLAPLTQIEIENARLELDRQRLELERQRLEDARERRSRSDGRRSRNKLVRDHLGTMITAIVSVAAILLSLTQVWIATSAKEHELQMQKIQQEQEWRFKALEFITKNSDAFFGKDQLRRERMSSALAAAFPPNIAGSLLSNLKQASNSAEARQTFVDTENRMHAKPAGAPK